MSDMTLYTRTLKDLDLALRDAGLERTRLLLARLDAEVGAILGDGAQIANDQRKEIERLSTDLSFVNSVLPVEFISDGIGGVRKWRESWEAWLADYHRSRKLETDVRAALGIEREAITPADAVTRLKAQLATLTSELDPPWIKIEPGCAMPVLSDWTYDDGGERVACTVIDLAWTTEDSSGVQEAAGWGPHDRFKPHHTHWRHHPPLRGPRP